MPRARLAPLNAGRRRVLGAGGQLGLLALLAAAGFLRPRDALAQQWNAAAFSTHGIAATLKALGVSGSVENSGIQIGAPDVSENGAYVPISVTSQLARTESIAILLENNPNALSAVFDVPAGTDPYLSLNVKLAESTNVYALVRAGGRYYHARREVRVTIGGCGQ